MVQISLRVTTPVSRSVRARQVESLFDVPSGETQTIEWDGDLPMEDRPWNVGLIVGPSGSGKTQIARRVFGEHYHPELIYSAPSVLDDVRSDVPVQRITEAFAAVGFNTIPAWLRPFAVLSNGERFRADLARRILELPDPIVVDEFSSVVDRQVAQIGSHAVQKLIRRAKRRFVAVGCHYDVIDWLQPDWIFEPAVMKFAWRLPQRRPPIDVEICRVGWETWRTFSPFHYLTADLHRAATCFALFVGDRPVAFAGVLHMPHATAQNIKRVSRLVTLPDWQGLGLAFVLVEALGAAYRDAGCRLRMYPAHLALVKAFAKSPRWGVKKKLGDAGARSSATTTKGTNNKSRLCAVFEYVGPVAADRAGSLAFLSGEVTA